MDRPKSLVPVVPRRSAEDFVDRIENLKAEATTRGFDTLSYFLDIALQEAMVQTKREVRDRKDKTTPSTDLWLSEG